MEGKGNEDSRRGYNGKLDGKREEKKGEEKKVPYVLKQYTNVCKPLARERVV